MTPEQPHADSLRDAIAVALHDVQCRAVGCSAHWRGPAYQALTDAVMTVLAREPWSGWAYVGAAETNAEPSSPAAPHVGPFRGPCGFCAGGDARHRTVDAALGMVGGGDEPAEVDDEYGWPAGTTAALIEGWRPDDWQGPP